MIAYLDTHVVIRLADPRQGKVSRDALRLIDRADIRISPIVRLEIEFIHEIQRFVRPATSLVKQLQDEIGMIVCDLPFDSVAEAAAFEGWTRDPFDRLIVAQAKVNGNAPLITADEHIHRNYPRAVW